MIFVQATEKSVDYDVPAQTSQQLTSDAVKSEKDGYGGHAHLPESRGREAGVAGIGLW